MSTKEQQAMETNGLNGQAERTRDAGPADNHDHCEPDTTTKGTDVVAQVQGDDGTTRNAAASKVERPAADPAPTAKPEDWRTTECVIESDGTASFPCRILHNPSGLVWYAPCPACPDGEFKSREWDDFAGHWYTPAEAERFISKIPDSARPRPVRSAVYVGNEISNRPATPDEAARAAADANAVATQVESLCDQFGIKPPEGKGVPAAPSPDFVTWDDRPVYRGAVLAPVTAPGSQWIAGEIVAGDLLELIGVDGKREIMLSREAFKSCWGYADRRAETQQDPEDIAQAIFLELDLAVKTEPTRRRLRSLVLKLLRSR